MMLLPFVLFDIASINSGSFTLDPEQIPKKACMLDVWPSNVSLVDTNPTDCLISKL